MNEEDLFIKRLDAEPEVMFMYRKLDGSIRMADGTRQTGEYSADWDNSRQVHTYWDNMKEDYRCFKDGNLVATIKAEPKLKRIIL
jgi:hypothetical protein